MFTSPLYLFALTGLTIPIAIHLLSRKEGKIIKIGSVRHVKETSTQQFRGIRLNEIFLLILRCALITLFCLLLAGLQFSLSKKEKWVLLEKGLERLPNLIQVIDSLEKEGYDAHWLNDGFPSLEDSSRVTEDVNYWRLVQELEKKNVSDAIVFSQNKINNFKGERISLPENIRWISQSLPATEFIIKATPISQDSLLIRIGQTDATQTNFISKKISSRSNSFPVSAPDTIKITLAADKEFSLDQKIIDAALKAIENSIPIKIKVTQTSSNQIESATSDWMIWLSTRPPRGQFRKIISFHQQTSNTLIEQLSPAAWIITRRLNEEIALHENLALMLASLLIPENKEQAIANSNDRRMLSDSIAWRSKRDLKIESKIQYQSADSYLIILLVVLLFIERMVAYKKNQ